METDNNNKTKKLGVILWVVGLTSSFFYPLCPMFLAFCKRGSKVSRFSMATLALFVYLVGLTPTEETEKNSEIEPTPEPKREIVAKPTPTPTPEPTPTPTPSKGEEKQVIGISHVWSNGEVVKVPESQGKVYKTESGYTIEYLRNKNLKQTDIYTIDFKGNIIKKVIRSKDWQNGGFRNDEIVEGDHVESKLIVDEYTSVFQRINTYENSALVFGFMNE